MKCVLILVLTVFTDLGWQLLLDTIRLISPSLIVQLTSNDRYQNVDPLNVESLNSYAWSDHSQVCMSTYCNLDPQTTLTVEYWK